MLYYFYGFDWVVVDGGFIGKYVSVCVVENGVGDVGDFSMGRVLGVMYIF